MVRLAMLQLNQLVNVHEYSVLSDAGFNDKAIVRLANYREAVRHDIFSEFYAKCPDCGRRNYRERPNRVSAVCNYCGSYFTLVGQLP